jgi:hypothetical protein
MTPDGYEHRYQVWLERDLGTILTDPVLSPCPWPTVRSFLMMMSFSTACKDVR